MPLYRPTSLIPRLKRRCCNIILSLRLVCTALGGKNIPQRQTSNHSKQTCKVRGRPHNIGGAKVGHSLIIRLACVFPAKRTRKTSPSLRLSTISHVLIHDSIADTTFVGDHEGDVSKLRQVPTTTGNVRIIFDSPMFASKS